MKIHDPDRAVFGDGDEPAARGGRPSLSGSSASEQAAAPTTGLRLPKLNAPSFSGTPSQWNEFWDLFRSSVDSNPSLSAVQKFAYLKGMISGKALSAIAGYAVTNDNYAKAVETLQHRFAPSQQQVF